MTRPEIKEQIRHEKWVRDKRSLVRRELLWAIIMYKHPSTRLGNCDYYRFSWL